jgi:hypothetical protein
MERTMVDKKKKTKKKHMNRISKHKTFLIRLLNSSRQQQQQQDGKGKDVGKLIKGATQGEICSVCEVVKNLIHNPLLNIKPTVEQQMLLRKNARAIRKLTDKNLDFEKKRKILVQQKGRGFIIPLITALAGPILNRLLLQQ